jgi:membrane protease subunit (stomatin/prohibitin family)
MALIDIVKFDGNSEEFVWKFPSENLRLGTQLVVKSGQIAIFVKGGKILDEFKEGTVTLKSGNIPLLTNLLSLPFGGDTPFQAEVWFVNILSKLDVPWGTVRPIQLEDPRYGVVVPVRAFGQFGFHVTEPRQFLEKIVGTAKVFTATRRRMQRENCCRFPAVRLGDPQLLFSIY